MLVSDFIKSYEEIHGEKLDKEEFLRYVIRDYLDPSDCYWIVDYMVDYWTGLGTEDVTETLLDSLDSVLTDEHFQELLDEEF